MKKPATLTAALVFCALSSIAGNKGRLIGAANYNADSSGKLHIVDSFALKYAGEKESSCDPNTLAYNLNHGNFTTDFYNAELVSSNVVQAHPAPRISYDTLLYFQASGSAINSKPSSLETASFNPDSSYNLVELSPNLLSGSGASVVARQALGYSKGKLSTVYLIVQVNSRIDTVSKRFLLRDAGDRIVTDSFVEYNTGGAAPVFSHSTIKRYSYDAAGLFVAEADENAYDDPSFVLPGSSYALSYYPDGRLYTYRNNGASNYFIDTFRYSNGLAGYTAYTRTVFDYATNSVIEKYSYASHLNAAGLKDSTFYTATVNGVPNLRTQQIGYDADGNPTDIAVWNTANGLTTLQSKSFYYYYQDSITKDPTPLSVPSDHRTGAIVYPNPTSGVVTFRASVPTNGACRLEITNAGGKQVRNESLELQTGAQQVNLGAEIPAGNYYIHLTDHSGKILLSQLLTKL